jgi:hypothetical protein
LLKAVALPDLKNSFVILVDQERVSVTCGSLLMYFRIDTSHLGDLVDTQVLHFQVEVFGVNIENYRPVAACDDCWAILSRHFA